MNILLNSVNVTDKGRYKEAIAQYVRDGKAQEKKVISFANPKVFEFLTGLGNFPVEVSVTNVKNAKGFWEWSAINHAGAAGEPQGDERAIAIAAGPKRISNFETPEERAARQVMIVRQSSLSSAVALLAANGGKKNTAQDVIDVAREFEKYVMGTGIVDIKDDVPF